MKTPGTGGSCGSTWCIQGPRALPVATTVYMHVAIGLYYPAAACVTLPPCCPGWHGSVQGRWIRRIGGWGDSVQFIAELNECKMGITWTQRDIFYHNIGKNVVSGSATGDGVQHVKCRGANCAWRPLGAPKRGTHDATEQCQRANPSPWKALMRCCKVRSSRVWEKSGKGAHRNPQLNICSLYGLRHNLSELLLRV